MRILFIELIKKDSIFHFLLSFIGFLYNCPPCLTVVSSSLPSTLHLISNQSVTYSNTNQIITYFKSFLVNLCLLLNKAQKFYMKNKDSNS